jgi:hypothetical protein
MYTLPTAQLKNYTCALSNQFELFLLNLRKPILFIFYNLAQAFVTAFFIVTVDQFNSAIQ